MPDQPFSGSLTERPAAPLVERGLPSQSAGHVDDELTLAERLEFARRSPMTLAVNDPVQTTVAGWLRALAAAGAPETLLLPGPLASATWLELTQAHPSGLAQLFAARPTRLSSLFREPGAHASARRQARLIRSTSIALAAERGVRACCLAIGMATWRPTDASPGEPVSSVVAPVVLRRCSVTPRDRDLQDFDLDLDDTVVINPELLRVLVASGAVDAHGGRLAALADGPKGFDPRPVYAWLEDRADGLPGFRIERRLLLAAFSTGSGAVLADLAAAAPAIAAHDLLGPAVAGQHRVGAADSDPESTSAAGERRVAVVGRLGPRAVTTGPARPPEEPDPGTELRVLDLDPAQQRAVETVAGGGHVVIDGPPGSGVTHTLAASIGSLVATGRRVLVVSARRSGTQALLERLDAARLSDLVLDVDGPTGGSHFRQAPGLERVRRALADASDESSAIPNTTEPDADQVAALLSARQLLDGSVTALHEVRGPWRVTGYEAMVALAELRGRPEPPRSRVRLSAAVLGRLTPATRERMRVHLHAAAAAGAFTVSRLETRWYDADLSTGAQARQALEAALVLRAGLERACSTMDAVTAVAGMRPAGRPADWGPLLDVLLGVRATLDVLDPTVFEHPLDELVAATATRVARRGDSRTRAERRRLRKQANALVRPGVHVPDVHAVLVRAREQARRWAELSITGSGPRVVIGLPDASAAVGRVVPAIDVLAAAFESSAAPDPRMMPLPDLHQRVFDLAGDSAGALGQPRRATLIAGLREAGLGDLVDDLMDRRVRPDRIDGELDLVWWNSVLDEVIAGDERLSRHHPGALREASQRLQEAEAALVAGAGPRVLAGARTAARAAVNGHPDQVDLLLEELDRQDRTPRPLDLVRIAPELVGRLCPIWVMGPDSVAAGLPPAESGLLPAMDVVVLDDAGHVGLPEVAAALVRGGQLVLAGDRHRLAPPEGAGPAVIEALEPFTQVCRLDRDHRATDGRMLLPLAPQYPEDWLLTPGTADLPPLHLEKVDGAVALPEPGEEPALSSAAEVDRVVDLVEEHARWNAGQSLVVVTISERHAERIESALRERSLERPTLATWLSTNWHEGDGMAAQGTPSEGFSVLPVTRLLGVQRDVALVSVGLPRTPHGRLLHRFGVLDSDGGAALLTSAVSRARLRTVMLCCFTAEDLVTDRLRTAGGRLLRDVLLAAGRRVQPASPGRLPAGVDGLVADLRERLIIAGMPARLRATDGEWPLDIAIADPRGPGRALVAVDVDGPGFARRSTRERELHRPARWRSARWSYCKVSALDLFRDPALEVERIRDVWTAALAADAQAGMMTGVPVPESSPWGPGLPDPSAGDPAEPEGLDYLYREVSSSVADGGAHTGESPDHARGPGSLSEPADTDRMSADSTGGSHLPGSMTGIHRHRPPGADDYVADPLGSYSVSPDSAVPDPLGAHPFSSDPLGSDSDRDRPGDDPLGRGSLGADPVMPDRRRESDAFAADPLSAGPPGADPFTRDRFETAPLGGDRVDADLSVQHPVHGGYDGDPLGQRRLDAGESDLGTRRVDDRRFGVDPARRRGLDWAGSDSAGSESAGSELDSDPVTSASPPRELGWPAGQLPPVLPDQTVDDTDLGWGDQTPLDDDDDRFVQERPPHWE